MSPGADSILAQPPSSSTEDLKNVEGSQEEIDDQSIKSQAPSENTSGTVAIQNESESPTPGNTGHVEQKEELEVAENIAEAENSDHTEKEGKL